MRSEEPSRVAGVILLIFVVSGAAGLIDEIVWSRQLVLVFGNTTQAVSAILTGFFGGIAVGSLVGGRIADRVRSPLRMYGLLELILVVVVLATPLTFRLIDDTYRAIYPSLEANPQLLALVRMALSILALAPATIMMGATLPTLTRHLTRGGHLSTAFGKLYAANTIGAVVGTLVAGFVLIEILGLTGALVVGAGSSGLAGLAALGLDHLQRSGRSPGRPTVRPTEADQIRPAVSLGPTRIRLALAVAFVSGLTSLGYQVLWTRLLASGTGNSTYIFTVILGLFLIGLAIGALIWDIIRPRLQDPVRLIASAQVLIAVLVLLGLVGVLERPELLDPTKPLQVTKALFFAAVPVVLLTTVVLGLTFPAATALLGADDTHTGRSAGTFLAINTLGAITGSFVVPFALIPTIGSPRALVLLALINVITGVGLALRGRRSQATAESAWKHYAIPTVAAAVGVAIVMVAAVPGALVEPNVARLRILNSQGTLFASTEDEIATVEAGEYRSTPELWVAGTSMTVLTVDAKLMPLLPLMARPTAKDALIVAFGMGTAFRSALIAGLRTDVVELVPSVPKMFHFYYPDADAVLANPNGRVIIADGRNHLELTDKRYDIIVTDPPPPIESSGASVISSLEYYQAGRDHLTPHGVMMQWLPYGETVNELRAHVRSFVSVFPEVTMVIGPIGYGVYMLGSDQPVEFPSDSIRAVLSRPGVLDDVDSAFDTPVHSIDEWISEIHELTWVSGAQVTAFAGTGPMVTDDRPLAEYYLIRRLVGDGSPLAGPGPLRAATPPGQ